MPGAAPAPGAPAVNNGANEGGNSVMKQGIQALAMFLGAQAVMRLLTGYLAPAQPATSPAQAPGSNPISASEYPAVSGSASSDLAWAPSNALPIWPLGTNLSMYVFFDTLANEPSSFLSLADAGEMQAVVWNNLTYGDWKMHREIDLELDVPTSVQENGTWFADIFIRPQDEGLDGEAHYRKTLTKHMPKKKIRKEKKLVMVGGKEVEDEDTVAEQEKQQDSDDKQPVLGHFSNNLTLALVANGGAMQIAAQPPQVRKLIKYGGLDTESQSDQTVVQNKPVDGTYLPILYFNDFWQLKEKMIPLNTSTTTVPLRITLDSIPMWRFGMYAAMSDSLESENKNVNPLTGTTGGGPGGVDIDELKKMLMTANPYWLVITIIVTLLHTLFEFLAFSSDVSHWRKKDRDLVGVSLRSIVTNVVVQLVILLYLQDSSEETSFMILMSQGISLLVEAWKITKVVDISIQPNPDSVIPYRIAIEDKHELSEDEKKTQEYDRLAFKIVGYVTTPLLLAYAVYSLLYKTHKGWYSFIISTLAQAIYMFGFAQLVPQLIINYKLKSVAHLPMKAMIYKTLTTIVDDCASFVIHMPWLHRLACFRDDVVFAILLYQRWIYRIDYSRANEYGQIAVGVEEPVESDKPGHEVKGVKAGNKLAKKTGGVHAKLE